VAGISRDELLRALRRLGELALAEGLTLELCLYGGRAFMLVYGTRIATRDENSWINSCGIGLRLAKIVAVEQGLPNDWLNDQMKVLFASIGGRSNLPLAIPGLKLYASIASHLLALKTLACCPPNSRRRGDWDDLKFLINKMEIKSPDEIKEHIDRYYPEHKLTAPQWEILTEILEEAIREHKM